MEEDELNDLFQAEGGECIDQRDGELVKGIGTARDRLGLFVQRGRRRGVGGELSLERDQEALCKLTPGAAGGKPTNAASFTAKKRGGRSLSLNWISLSKKKRSALKLSARDACECSLAVLGVPESREVG